MKTARSTVLIALAALPAVALAHAHLTSSTPGDGSVVSAAPSSIMLIFSEPARLTALTLQKGEGKSEQKLAPLPAAASAHVTVPTPTLSPGAYTIRWRALGKDNHVIRGTIRFTLSIPEKGPPSKAGNDKPPLSEHDPHSRSE